MEGGKLQDVSSGWGRLTYAMIHGVVSQRWSAQRSYYLEFSRPSVDGLDYDRQVVCKAFTPEQALRLESCEGAKHNPETES